MGAGNYKMLGGQICGRLVRLKRENVLNRRMLIKALGLAVCLTFCFGTSATSAVAKTKITKKGFKYGGMHYWRAGAQNVKLGTYGNKRSSYGMEVHNDIKAKHFGKAVDVSGQYTINWKKDKDFAAKADVQYVGWNAKGGYSRQAKKGANLKLVLMNIKKGRLQKIINKKAKGARNFLKKNKNGRVVSGVWVVMEAKLANQISQGGGLAVDGVTPNGIKISGAFSGKSKERSSVNIPKGAIFAYMMHKVSKWNKKKVKGKILKKKSTIKEMKDDQVGIR